MNRLTIMVAVVGLIATSCSNNEKVPEATPEPVVEEVK